MLPTIKQLEIEHQTIITNPAVYTKFDEARVYYELVEAYKTLGTKDERR